MSHTPNDRPSPESRDVATDHGAPRDGRGDGSATSDRAAAEGRDDGYARGKFGGLNIGAAFFGWLVAIAVTVLLVSIVGAVLSAVGAGTDVTQTEAQRQAGTIGITAAVVLLVVMVLAYLVGGYVAGRMSRFDGGKQGLGVWVIGLVVTVVAIVLGAVLGAQYNLLDRVSLPRLPVSLDQLGWGGLLTAVLVLVGTLVAAMAGGKLGERYHHRVDRALRR